MKRNLYRKAITHFGIKAQIDKTVEELAEVTEAILKHKDGRDSDNHVCEEIADAIIMLEQMQEFYGFDEVEDWREIKLRRLQNRIDNNQ